MQRDRLGTDVDRGSGEAVERRLPAGATREGLQLSAQHNDQRQRDTVGSHAARGAADGGQAGGKRRRLGAVGVEVRGDDRRRAVIDLELDDLRHEVVEHERVVQQIVGQRLRLPERHVHDPGVLRVGLAL